MNLPDPCVLKLPTDMRRVDSGNARNGHRTVSMVMPISLYRAIKSLAELENKSVRAKILELLVAQMGHEFYEQTMDWESAVDRPSKDRVAEWEQERGRG